VPHPDRYAIPRGQDLIAENQTLTDELSILAVEILLIEDSATGHKFPGF